MIGGQHLRVEGRYLGAYAVHAGWLEDHRDESNGRLADRLICGALAVPVSRAWKGYWQRRAARPCLRRSRSHALSLLHHADKLAASGVTERMEDLENHRVPQRRIRDVEATLGHDVFSKFARRHLPIHIEMTDADIGDLPLLEEAVADHLAGALSFRRSKQLDRRVHMRQIMLHLRYLSFIGLAFGT